MKTKKTDVPPHLFVTNPYSGKLINVLPLFELMNHAIHTTVGPDDIRIQIQEVHDFVSTNPPSDDDGQISIAEWSNINYTLVNIRKAFERMQEVSA